MKMNIESKLILKDLHDVLMKAKTLYKNSFVMQEIQLTDSFKNEFNNYLLTKECSANFLDKTTVVTNAFKQDIFIANQWFVIASYFVDFCSEMLSYQNLFYTICSRLGYSVKGRKNYAIRLKTAPTYEDKKTFISLAIIILKEQFPHIEDNYERAANLLWKFVSNYSWWAGSKTIDRHDFFVSALLKQMNVVNANSEYLAFITLSYASVLKLRIMIDDVNNIAVGYKGQSAEDAEPEQVDDVPVIQNEEPQYRPSPVPHGISISAASLERFHNN